MSRVAHMLLSRGEVGWAGRVRSQFQGLGQARVRGSFPSLCLSGL